MGQIQQGPHYFSGPTSWEAHICIMGPVKSNYGPAECAEDGQHGPYMECKWAK